MIIPIRCFSCGKVRCARCLLLPDEPQLTSVQVVGDLWERYLRLVDDGVEDGYVPVSAWVSRMQLTTA